MYQGMSEEEFVMEIAEFIGEYVTNWMVPMTAVILNRRFGTWSKKLTGKSLLVLLRSHPSKFQLIVNVKGGTNVATLI